VCGQLPHGRGAGHTPTLGTASARPSPDYGRGRAELGLCRVLRALGVGIAALVLSPPRRGGQRAGSVERAFARFREIVSTQSPPQSFARAIPSVGTKTLSFETAFPSLVPT